MCLRCQQALRDTANLPGRDDLSPVPAALCMLPCGLSVCDAMRIVCVRCHADCLCAPSCGLSVRAAMRIVCACRHADCLYAPACGLSVCAAVRIIRGIHGAGGV